MIPWSRAEIPLDSWVLSGAEVGRACAPCAPCDCPPCPQETRLKEGIVKLKPHEEPLRSELLSGKFTILVGGVSSPGSYPSWVAYPSSAPRGCCGSLTPFPRQSVRDPSGASIALFTAKLHHPSKSVQHVVLQALFYLLDRAVER